MMISKLLHEEAELQLMRLLHTTTQEHPVPGHQQFALTALKKIHPHPSPQPCAPTAGPQRPASPRGGSGLAATQAWRRPQPTALCCDPLASLPRGRGGRYFFGGRSARPWRSPWPGGPSCGVAGQAAMVEGRAASRPSGRGGSLTLPPPYAVRLWARPPRPEQRARASPFSTLWGGMGGGGSEDSSAGFAQAHSGQNRRARAFPLPRPFPFPLPSAGARATARQARAAHPPYSPPSPNATRAPAPAALPYLSRESEAQPGSPAPSRQVASRLRGGDRPGPGFRAGRGGGVGAGKAMGSGGADESRGGPRARAAGRTRLPGASGGDRPGGATAGGGGGGARALRGRRRDGGLPPPHLTPRSPHRAGPQRAEGAGHSRGRWGGSPGEGARGARPLVVGALEPRARSPGVVLPVLLEEMVKEAVIYPRCGAAGTAVSSSWNSVFPELRQRSPCL